MMKMRGRTTRALLLISLNVALGALLLTSDDPWPAVAICAAGLLTVAVAANQLIVREMSARGIVSRSATQHFAGSLSGALGVVVRTCARLRFVLAAGLAAGFVVGGAVLLADLDASVALIAITPVVVGAAFVAMNSARDVGRGWAARLVTGRSRARVGRVMGVRGVVLRSIRAGTIVYLVALAGCILVVSIKGDSGRVPEGFALGGSLLAAAMLVQGGWDVGAVASRSAKTRRAPQADDAAAIRSVIDLGCRDLITVVTPVRSGVDPQKVPSIWDSGDPGDDRVDLQNIRWVVVGSESDGESFRSGLLAGMGQRLAFGADLSSVEVVLTSEEGAGVKRNAGLSAVHTDFVAFVDADDKVDLPALRKAIQVVLSSEAPNSAVHNFPFWVERSSNARLQLPSSGTVSQLTHSHCARVYPRPVFTDLGLRYEACAREDAVFLLDLYELVRQEVHVLSETAFLRYVDHSQEDDRLTRRRGIDTAHFISRIASLADRVDVLEPGAPGKKRSAITEVFWGRVAYELAAGNSSRTAVGRVMELAQERGPLTMSPIGRDVIFGQVEGARARLGRAAASSSLASAIVTHVLDLSRSKEQPGLRGSLGDSATATDPIVGHALELARCRSQWSLERSAQRERTPIRVDVTVGDDVRERFDAYERAVVEHFFAPFPLAEGSPEVSEGTGDQMQARVQLMDAGGDRHRDGTSGKAADAIEIDLGEQYAASRLLRLWGRLNPADGPMEAQRSAAFFDALRLFADWDLVRLYGTGPSAENLARSSASCEEGLGVACNSMVCQPDLLEALNVRVLTAADPVFHAGPSPYAEQFRRDTADWLRRRRDNIFVTVTRDIHVYLRHLPWDVHDQIVALEFSGTPDSSGSSIVTLRDGTVRPHSNILTLLMLPIAANVGRGRIHLTGFDGADPDEKERFWHYASSLNYSEELQDTVRAYHPGFFSLDLQAYRSSHSDVLSAMIGEASKSGLSLTVEAKSHIPALRHVEVSTGLHE